MKPATDYRAGNPARYHAHWLLRDGDRIVGPVSLDLLERGIRAGKVPLTAEMALDGHDEWLPISRVLPRVRPEVHLALPAPAVEAVPVKDVTPDAETMPETPTALDAPGAVPSQPTPAGEPSHIRARKTCIFWPARSAPIEMDEAAVEERASESESSFVGEIVEGELLDDEWKRATVRRRPSPLPQSWRHRTVLCAPDEADPENAQAVAEVFAAQQRDVEAEGPATDRMAAPETDRMPHVGEPDAEEARAAQMRAWQATTQQRRIAPAAQQTAQHASTPPPAAPSPAQHPSTPPPAQPFADQPWSPAVPPVPGQPWHQQPWHGNGRGNR